MSEFKKIVGSFIIVLILAFSLFSFIILSQEENSAAEPLRENELFNDSFTGLIVTIDESTSAAEEKYNIFNEEQPKEGFGSIVLLSIVSVGKTFSSIVFGTFGAIIKLPLVVFGIPQTIYNLLLTLLIIVIIVAIWLFYKLGG